MYYILDDRLTRKLKVYTIKRVQIKRKLPILTHIYDVSELAYGTYLFISSLSLISLEAKIYCVTQSNEQSCFLMAFYMSFASVQCSSLIWQEPCFGTVL